MAVVAKAWRIQIAFANAGLHIASKHAVPGLTKTASIEWFKRGVRVNAVNPGIIDTEFQDRIWPSSDAKYSFAASTVPGGAGTPQEVAKVVAFLALGGFDLRVRPWPAGRWRLYRGVGRFARGVSIPKRSRARTALLPRHASPSARMTDVRMATLVGRSG